MIEGFAVHEFGHVMGYSHEQDQDAAFADEDYVYPTPANQFAGRACSPTGYWDAAADAFIFKPPGFNNFLVTTYDPDSIMNYCHLNGREWSGRMSSLDITGVQTGYGAYARLDMDKDGVADYRDNCPFVPNAGDQLDSNLDSELTYAKSLNPSCTQWCEDGHRPIPTDSQAYVDWWHLHYAGDACDETAVTATAPDNIVFSSLETKQGCLDIVLGGGTPWVNNSEVCKVQLNTGMTFDGHIGGPTGMTRPTPAPAQGTAPARPANPSAPTFCKCSLGSAAACAHDQATNCPFGDAYYPYAAQFFSSWQKISMEVPTSGSACSTSADCPNGEYCYLAACKAYCGTTPCTEIFPELNISHVDPVPGYDSSPLFATWDFIADLPTFGMAANANNLTGMGWTHERNYPYSIVNRPEVAQYNQVQPVDMQNTYWVQTATWAANHITAPSVVSYQWQPIPYCNPGPKQEVEHSIRYMTVANLGGTPVYIGVNGSTLFDESLNITAGGQALLATLPSGNELLVASDRIGGQPSDSTGYNAVVLNSGTPKVVGAIVDSVAQMKIDGAFASSVAGSGTATLKTFSATNQALYWLSSGGTWTLNTRLLSNAMAGNATTTTTSLTGVTLQSPKAVAYNRVTNALFVVDWIVRGGANAIRLLSVDLTSGVATELWTTSPFSVSPAPSLFVSTTSDGEGIVSVSQSAGSGAIDVLLVSSTGRPLGAYSTTGTLASAVVGRGDGITIPMAVNTTGAPNIQTTFVNRSALKYGACNSSLFLGVASPPGIGVSNPDFETGDLTYWTTVGASVTIAASGHTGSYSAMLGLSTPTNGDSTISQTFNGPVGSTGLSFWYQMTCPDTVVFDWATATLTDNTTSTNTTPLPKVCATGAWTQVNASLVPGHNYTLSFTSHDDNYGTDPTYTLFDGVTFTGTSPTGALVDGPTCP